MCDDTTGDDMSIKKLQNLTIEDNFMFQKVMQDETICKEFIEKLLNIKIKNITYPETEKTITHKNKGKGIRLDVYVETDNGKMIDIEMQTSEINRELPKRTRYYQGMMDINSLPKGESYKNLKESYIVFVCSFDPFKYSRLIYTFRNKCIEIEDLELDDKATKIFLNATGMEGKVNLDIKNFLKYINTGEVKGEFTNRINNKLKELKNREEMGVEYMTYELFLQDARDDGYDKGFNEGRNEGFNEGRNEGFNEGRNEGTFLEKIRNLKRLMNKMGISANEAMELLDVSESDKEKYISALTNNIGSN